MPQAQRITDMWSCISAVCGSHWKFSPEDCTRQPQTLAEAAAALTGMSVHFSQYF
jgi:hypothetical protein